MHKITNIFLLFVIFYCCACESKQGSTKKQEHPSAQLQKNTVTPEIKLVIPEICKQPEFPQKNLPKTIVTIKNQNGTHVFSTDIAQSPQEQQIGLMCQQHLPSSNAMLFVFKDMRPRSFWMKNTLISLDILFIDQNLKIVSIQAGTTPLSLENLPSYHAAKYVLEIRGGLSKLKGIHIGDHIQLQ